MGKRGGSGGADQIWKLQEILEEGPRSQANEVGAFGNSPQSGHGAVGEREPVGRRQEKLINVGFEKCGCCETT